ncbi:NYN domain-containing protein [Patescibacteria group bacterium]|nr:NYN domain-containing protein [Patescibacteria group bacterium]
MSLLQNLKNGKITEIKSLYVFIDSSNLWAAQKSEQKLLDYEKILNYIKDNFKPSRLKVFYYAAYPAEGTRGYSIKNKHKFFTFLKKGLGFEVRKKELKRIKIVNEDLGESIKEKGDMDVEITVDAMYHIDKYDAVIFFSGDSDFLPLVNHLKNNNKIVYILSSRNNISEELRTAGHGYCDVLDIDDFWGNDLKNREDKKITLRKEDDSRM